MTGHPIRFFAAAADIRRIGEAMLACTLPKTEWTHEAHLATCAWLILERPDVLPERDLPALIRRYNESVGGVNDDTQGYHETITQVAIRARAARRWPGAKGGRSARPRQRASCRAGRAAGLAAAFLFARTTFLDRSAPASRPARPRAATCSVKHCLRTAGRRLCIHSASGTFRRGIQLK